ncbi:MAG TPA: class I SAM-dependent methyltransferase [Deltaproteobacteria bacterium]|nr:class I SAM-dependent methyltransferase [Deltaproteobacteria bacterium]
MSLDDATFAGAPLGLAGSAPYPTEALRPWVGRAFFLPCDDPWVRGAGDRDHAYLDGARTSWSDHPEYMDFLDPDSPVYDLKRAEADLYLHHWGAHRDATTVLDVGCGVGRFATRFLDRGATVYGVDPDLESLRRLAWHAPDRPGRLDLSWSSAHHLPEVEVELALAVEVLCYVPDAEGALAHLATRVRPGGTVLLSVESRWGWASSPDAPAGAIEAALQEEGVIDLPGDRWVRLYDEPRIRALIEGAGLELVELIASHWIPDGPLEGCAPLDLSLEELVALEERCRLHPIWGPMHRLWLVEARRPT